MNSLSLSLKSQKGNFSPNLLENRETTLISSQIDTNSLISTNEKVPFSTNDKFPPNDLKFYSSFPKSFKKWENQLLIYIDIYFRTFETRNYDINLILILPKNIWNMNILK